jgi:hypothetical protein
MWMIHNIDDGDDSNGNDIIIIIIIIDVEWTSNFQEGLK